jgi:hypothetical protein
VLLGNVVDAVPPKGACMNEMADPKVVEEAQASR